MVQNRNSRWRPSAVLDFPKFDFWPMGLIRPLIFHLDNKFGAKMLIDAQITAPNRNSRWRPSAILDFPKFDFWPMDLVRQLIFTCVSYAEARLSSVRPSHAGIVSKRLNIIVMLSSPHDSQFILVLCVSRSSRNSDGVTLCGVAKQRWGMKISQFSTNISLYLRNGWR